VSPSTRSVLEGDQTDIFSRFSVLWKRTWRNVFSETAYMWRSCRNNFRGLHLSLGHSSHSTVNPISFFCSSCWRTQAKASRHVRNACNDV
jgi:hypothetical protein